MNIEITKEVITKTDYFICVNSDTRDWTVFQNLPNHYTEDDVKKELEMIIQYDFGNTI